MGADNTFGETNFNPEKISLCHVDYIDSPMDNAELPEGLKWVNRTSKPRYRIIWRSPGHMVAPVVDGFIIATGVWWMDNGDKKGYYL